MIKDTLLKSLLIPLLGILIPFFGGLIQFKPLGAEQILFSDILFVITSYTIWQGNTKIISSVRIHPLLRSRIILKLVVLCSLTALFSFFVCDLSSVIWEEIFLKAVVVAPVLKTGTICVVAVLFLTGSH